MSARVRRLTPLFSGMARRSVPAEQHSRCRNATLYYHVTVRTGEQDLHSGQFGGVALNAAHALIAALFPAVAQPAVLQVGLEGATASEMALWQRLEPGDELLMAAGAAPADPRAGMKFYERTLKRASVDVNGLTGGEPRLQKTIIPVRADANVSIRLGPGQDLDTIDVAFRQLLETGTPPGSTIQIETLSAVPPASTPGDSQPMALARAAFERVLGTEPELLGLGGTLPIMSALCDRDIPTILTGFADPTSNVHAPNERFELQAISLGIRAATEMLVAFGAL